MTTDLIRTTPAAPGLDVMTMGKMLAQSGYFQDARDAAQAVVKVLAGQEMGIGAIAAMTGIYIVKGRVTLSANLMAAQIKRSGRYNYRVTRLDDTGCEIAFYEGSQEIGRSSFTADDAKAAGLWNSSDPWKKTPRNMLFARAMSNGAKWYTPDVFSGPVYTPDELDEGDAYTSPPASEKQRTYIAVLQEKLDWNSEQLAAYANEQSVDLVTLTQEQASAFIDSLKTLTEQRSPLPPIRQITTKAPEALPDVERLQRDLKALRECERAIGLPLPAFGWNPKKGPQPLKDEIAASRGRLIERIPGLLAAAGDLLEGSADGAAVAQFHRYATLVEGIEMVSHADLIEMATWLFAAATAEAEVVEEAAL